MGGRPSRSVRRKSRSGEMGTTPNTQGAGLVDRRPSLAWGGGAAPRPPAAPILQGSLWQGSSHQPVASSVPKCRPVTSGQLGVRYSKICLLWGEQGLLAPAGWPPLLPIICAVEGVPSQGSKANADAGQRADLEGRVTPGREASQVARFMLVYTLCSFAFSFHGRGCQDHSTKPQRQG